MRPMTNRGMQANLLRNAGGFLFLYAVIMTLAPVVREHTWDTRLPWTQWAALILWIGFINRSQRDIGKFLPDADPFIFPVAALLSGWGILAIWRLEDGLGARQTLWFTISVVIFIAGVRLSSLSFLQRYKYILLVGGVSLTALTLLFGTNPAGSGPRLWLGCCDIYFQPSEPLKLLLIVYLSAYLAEKLPYRLRMIHFLYPTLVLGGIVILLLVAQRDLGTASIFLGLYMVMTYLATGQRRMLIIGGVAFILVGLAGYYSFGIIQARVDSWFHPWLDPGGSSYQIIQGLISMANGGIEGRGPGLGSPGLVPVAVSDFIYTAIAEETGLFGTLGLLALFGILVTRGLRIALRAPDNFHRFLAAGISAYFGLQAILIVGGNLRLLPLTGVTLPFVSYGGSSLLTSFIAVLILLLISNHVDEEPAPLDKPAPYLMLNGFLLFGLFTSALANGWWAVVRAPQLLFRSDNLRRVIEERYVPRGALLDRSNSPIAVTAGRTGALVREYIYPDLAPVVGYNDPKYGQAGLEASLDGYLRGLEGNPTFLIFANHLLYGTTPHGLDVRLSLDLHLQSRADELMEGRKGAVVLLNAGTGEIWVMASHPTFNANQLPEYASELLNDPQKPLINRAALGLYPAGSAIDPFAQILFHHSRPDKGQLQDILDAFGFVDKPALRMDTGAPAAITGSGGLHVSPLQMALASTALSNKGLIPAPRIVLAVNTPRAGWVVLPALGKPIEAVQPAAVDEALMSYVTDGNKYWSHTAQADDGKSSVTWFIAGTLSTWQASPLTVVVLLEEKDQGLANRIGQELLMEAMNP